MPERSWPVRSVVAFGRFWVDFLVGDTPELLVGAVVVLGATAAIAASGSIGASGVAVAFLPLAVLCVLGISLARARSGRR